MSEVLKEFQCKNCQKILGSRAALQRHLKEVHEKQVDGACACSRCGKLFQNKSNLKIHMLTHSGIKPFKCAENNCIAAFTTKQCLQFHYKKVHAFTEEMMPKITRSVDYTFEAYSGDQENGENRPDMNNEDGIVEELSSDVEDNNLEEEEEPKSPIKNENLEEKMDKDMQDSYSITNLKILSKGSKKWIGESTIEFVDQIDNKIDESSNITLDVDDNEPFDPPKLNSNSNFNRHESSNASLLVEAALDSVCSEPNLDSNSQNCTDAIVNNLYTLAEQDNLPDVSYSNTDVNESRDINLISPSVNDHISVTDDLNEELRQSQNIGLDYSTFHQEDFSPAQSPLQNRTSFPRDYMVNEGNFENTKSPRDKLRYFNNEKHISSDDSNNGITAQNLSLNQTKDNLELDLSLYKSPYSLENGFSLRKDFRMMKFDLEGENRKHIYLLDSEEPTKFMGNSSPNVTVDNLENNSNLNDKDFESLENSELKTQKDIRNKFELDLELRMKSYDNLESDLRTRNLYVNENSVLDDFRLKNYDINDSIENRSNLEVRTKLYDNLLDTDFNRQDRNFEPIVLNSDLQGLDMSARSYHNFTNLNRYHHIYNDVERPSVDLRLNYSPPPPTYSHADILRVVSLDLTPPGRHSVDLSLRTHQITNSRLLDHPTHRLSIDQTSRLLSSDLGAPRHLSGETRLISDMSNRILSDHTTNRILSNDQLSTNRLISSDQRLLSVTEESRLITEPSRLLSDQPRLLDQSRLLSEARIISATTTSGSISPVPYAPYSVSPSPYHPTALPPRPPHTTSPTPPYHHYSAYY